MSHRLFYIEDNEAIPAIKYVENVPDGYTLIVDEIQLIRLYSGQYKMRQEDGKNYYSNFRSRLMLDMINGIYTSIEVFALELLLKTLADELTTGNWLTSQYVSQNLAIDGIYTQAMKDEIQSFIDEYIHENY